jgi:predicted nucleic acid-binding protein
LTGLVLDASITLAWTLEDEANSAADAVLARVVAQGATVPSVWRLEVANALRTAVRRGRCGESFVDRALGDLAGLEIIVDLETDARAWTDIRRLAREEGLTVYDAAYLELAVRLSASLASADAQLVAAARRQGVDVMSV